MTEIRPQLGFQTKALAVNTDIAVLGGAAGCSKTFTGLLDLLRWVKKYPMYAGLFMRRNGPDLFLGGGAWDTACDLYSKFGGRPVRSSKYIIFPNGAKIFFSSAQREKDIQKFQGQQFDVIFVDEASHFTEYQIGYLIGRLRSPTPIKNYLRLALNPEPGWAKEWVSWYLNASDYPDLVKAGKVRYMARDPLTGSIQQSETAKELIQYTPNKDIKEVKTFTFIPGLLKDNPLMKEYNENYEASLAFLPKHIRKSWQEGWWGGNNEQSIFDIGWLRDYVVPPVCKYYYVTCDTASSAGGKGDYSVACLWGLNNNAENPLGELYLLDMMRGRWTYEGLKNNLIRFLEGHSKLITGQQIFIEAHDVGVPLINQVRKFIPAKVIGLRKVKDKIQRAYHIAFYIEQGRMYLAQTSNDYKIIKDELGGFSADDSHEHDDIVDNFIDAINVALMYSHKQKYKDKHQLYYAVT